MLFIFQVALSYKNQILGYIDSYIARTRYLVSSIISKSYHKHFTISQTQCKDEASQINENFKMFCHHLIELQLKKMFYLIETMISWIN